MRCLTLAQYLRLKSIESSFICRELPGHLMDMVRDEGFEVIALPAPAKKPDQPLGCGYLAWLGVPIATDAAETVQILKKRSQPRLVVDSYALDVEWENEVRACITRLMVIDDLANRPHNCDILLDQNYSPSGDRYNGLVPPHCVKFMGPQWALLREQFYRVPSRSRTRDGSIRRLLVFLGAIDSNNGTEKALQAIRSLNRPDITVDVVVGQKNLFKNQVRELVKGMKNAVYHEQISNMAEILGGCDLAIGSGGTHTWERCFMGVPAIVGILAENQRELVENLAATGAIWNAGWWKEIRSDALAQLLRIVLEEPTLVKAASIKGQEIMGFRDQSGLQGLIDAIIA